MENCHFLKAETGAVTVDWVVLTAGLVGLGLATMAVVSTGVQDTSGDIESQLTRDHIIRSSFNFQQQAVGTGMGWGQAVSPACSAVPGQDPVCDPGSTTMYQEYWMEDGTKWVQQTHTVDGEEPVVTWKNADGDDVTADAPEIPDGLEWSQNHPNDTID